MLRINIIRRTFRTVKISKKEKKNVISISQFFLMNYQVRSIDVPLYMYYREIV